MNNSRLFKQSLRASALGIILGCGLGVQAETIYQTANMGVGANWNLTNYWSNGAVPTPGNDYVNANSNNDTGALVWGTRTPTSGSETFGGDSLTFTNGSFLNIKGVGPWTFNLMNIWAGSKISNGGANGAVIDGNLALKGTGTVLFDAQGTNRKTTIDSLMTVDPGIGTISIVMAQTAPSTVGYNGSGYILTNPDNTFAGLWDVQQGMLKGSGVGTGSFLVGAYGYLDLDAAYSNATADLTIDTGGLMLLDVEITVDTAKINFIQLAAKTWTAEELVSTFPSAFDATSTGSITVLTGPDPVPTVTVYQNSDMLPGIDWNDASYWDNSEAPSASYFYANNTPGWTTQTPVTSSTFGGYSLSIDNGASLNLQGAATYTVPFLDLWAGSAITKSAVGNASLNGFLTLRGTGEITFSALVTNSMTTISSSLVTSNASISKIIIDMEDGSVSNTATAAQSGFIFPLATDFDGLWQVNAGMLKGIGFGSGSFLVTDMGRLDFDAAYRNLDADLTIEASSTTNTAEGGTIILDQTVAVGSATIWGETLAPGLYTGAELKANPIYGAAFSGNWTLDAAILAVGVTPPVTQIANANPSALGWTDTNSWDNAEAPSLLNDYENKTSGMTTRNPSTGDQTFGGRSLTLSNGAQLKLQSNQSVTITNLTMHASSELRTVGNTTLNGDLAMVGNGSIICDVEQIRNMTVNSLVTAEATITNITIRASQTELAGPAGGMIFSNPANTFSGTWVIEEGYLTGAGLAQGSFTVKASGLLNLSAEYDNTAANLIVEVNPTNTTAGGQVLLGQNMTVGMATIWGTHLPVGVYSAVDLVNNPVYGGAFEPTSTGSLTVTKVPDVPEIGAVAYGLSDGGVVFGWAGSETANYTLQGKTDLVNGTWSNLQQVVGIDGAMSLTNATAAPVQFFRLVGESNIQ